MLAADDIARFWANVNRGGPIPDHRPELGPCWVWTASRKKFGYGRFVIRGRQWIASRVSWEITFGPIPAGRHVLHRCDNPPCIRPAHLFLGTNADNIADREAKGRTKTVRGSESGMAKLTEGQVARIKERYTNGATIPELARDYAVSGGLVGMIIAGRIWQHVGGSVRKGYASGERTNKNRVSEAQVREIRRRYVPGMRMQALADEYGVSLTTIYHIVKRNTWRDLE